MEVYMSTVITSLLTTVFIAFLVAMGGYLLGGIEIKGISLGTAGVLLSALGFGIICSQVGAFSIGERTITLYNDEIKSFYSLISSFGTAMFVTAVGLIAGPKFFRNFNKKMLAYLAMGVVVILTGAATAFAIIQITAVSPSLAIGLLTGALTSTPGLSAAKDAAVDAEAVTAGYGIAYIFGIIGVVLFVQLVPKILKVNIEQERKMIASVELAETEEKKQDLKKIDALDFFPFIMTIVLGMILGALYIPGIDFSLGAAGGTLIVGLVVGHFGRIGKIDLTVNKQTLNFFRELGLIFFLIGAGIPGGVNFIQYVKPAYFLYGAIMTLIPMLVGFLVGKYIFKLRIFNNLGSLTGGMTSTPALGTLISVAKTDEVSAAYAATYPVALVIVVLVAKILV